MIIKFKRCPIGLGYAYKVGATAESLPLKDKKLLIELGYAEDITPKPEKPQKAKVTKAVVRNSDKTVVRKKK